MLVDELVRGGVREAVLCPGSRNAPLSYALHEADRAGQLRLHVRIDERSAGFLALGLARASATPVPVCTTSGTAVANLHPAVLEASHSRVPLVVLSADRPPELLGTGANQTVRQDAMFGDTVRLGVTLSPATDNPGPQHETGQNARWRSAVCRVLAAATGARDGNAGPVHLNVGLREPLVPDGPLGPVPWPGRADGGPWSAVAPARVDAPVDVDLSVPTLVVAGDGAVALPELAAVPTVAEPSAPAPVLPVHPLALGATARLRPQQVVVTGRPTLHRPVLSLLGADDVAVHVVTQGTAWTDVAGTARSVGTRVVARGAPSQEWTQGWARASSAAEQHVAQQLTTWLAAGSATGLHVARVVADSLRSGDLLVLGSSNPVRDAAYAGLPKPGVRVLANRGVAGIDGTVSTALGAALAHAAGHHVPGSRTVALMGDLTFLHDSGGLLAGPQEPRADLTIVVPNDDGGGIFGLLEQGAPEHAGAFERVFGTAHGTDLGALCAAHGVAHRRVDLVELAAELVEAPRGVSSPRLRVLEVATTRTDLRVLHSRLRVPTT